tara:strand:+ start:345 stop:746 length:402 start_codon:yes stop_codon:yes gene_type:complete
MAMDERQKAELWGRRAEGLALFAMRLKGYRLLERRYRTPVGEIDLVMRRGRIVVALEVKARQTRTDRPVTDKQWRRISEALESYISRHPKLASLDRRYDLIEVTEDQWPRQTQDAWRPLTSGFAVPGRETGST